MELALVKQLPQLEQGHNEIISACHSLEARIAKLCAATPSGTLRRKQAAEGTELADFIKLQDCAAYNISGRVALRLPAVLKLANTGQNEAEQWQEAAVALLQLLQGCCLLHRPSRYIFAQEQMLLPLVRAIDHSSARVQQVIVESLPTVLVRHVEAIRKFESIGGLRIITDVFKRMETTKEIKFAIIGFLFFYMVPETRLGEEKKTNNGGGGGVARKTTADKQKLLGKYLSNVDGLVRELETNQPFGPIDIEW